MPTISDTITTQVKSLARDVKGLPETFKKIDIADLQKQAQGIAQVALGAATNTYADLKKSADDFFDKAEDSVEDVVEDVTKQAKGFAADAQKLAFDYVSVAKAQVTRVTSKAPTTARKTAEKVDTAVKKVPEPAKRASAAKKAPAKKTTAKKTTAKKSPAAVKKTVTPAAAKKTVTPAAATTTPPTAAKKTAPVKKAPGAES